MKSTIKYLVEKKIGMTGKVALCVATLEDVTRLKYSQDIPVTVVNRKVFIEGKKFPCVAIATRQDSGQQYGVFKDGSVIPL